MKIRSRLCCDNRLAVYALTSLLFVVFGCGPDIPPLGQVSGVVTMKGKPMPGIEVVFLPDPSTGNVAKSSRGETDASGRYLLTYVPAGGGKRVEGAAVGVHIVSMSDNLSINSREKPVPYRISLGLSKASGSPFKETVVDGEQQIDFDLTKHRRR